MYFSDDWDRTPYCSEWGHPTTIRVGHVCSAFSPQRDTAPGDARAAVGIDVEVDWSDSETGTNGPFYAAYRDDELYDWLCGNCLTFNVAIDTMGRFECTQCGNDHSPSEWDAAYL